MVNHGLLTAALSFPAISNGLEVRVNVELRSSDGRPLFESITDEVWIAKITAVNAIAELMHFEFSKTLAADNRIVDPVARRGLTGAAPAVVHHDQYVFDLFSEAIEMDCITLAL